MALQENLTNLAREITTPPSSLKDLPPELVYDIKLLVTLLQAAGILFIIYVVYLIISWVMTAKANKRIKQIHEKVEKINDKINFLIEKEKERELEKEKEKNKSLHKRKK